MLLLFGLALVINAGTASAANVTTDKIQPKVSAVNSANKTIIPKSHPIKVTFNEIIKSGTNSIVLSSKGKVNPIKTSINGKTLTITPRNALATGKYNLVIHTGSVTDLSGNNVSLFTTTFTVSKLTKAQMKDGLSRVQKFYNTNNRLPTYVNFGKTKISINEFKKIIATQGMKISTHTAAAVSKTNVKTVTAYGWNSCSSGWYKTGGTFINYCPFCHSYNCLVYNPKHTYEGEWTCSKCDADFCNCGRCKASGSSVFLTKA